VEAVKRVLIVTDDTAGAVAKAVAAVFSSLKAYKVVLVRGADFSGADLLPADLVFFGCSAPHPPGFARLETVLGHINLTGRRCGLFSAGSGEALSYLEDLLRDSEITVHPRTLPDGSPSKKVLRAWVREICKEA
jgi:hypothetical protein